MKTFILPGMGANSNMYAKEYYGHLTDVSFINWPIYTGEKTLVEMAKKTIEHYDIKAHDMLGGSSLGGIVALEMACILQSKRVILIGSTFDPKQINPILKSLGSFADLSPIKLIQFFLGKIHSETLNMFSAADPNFIKAMCKALSSWQVAPNFKGQIFQIHGQKDHIICPPKTNVSIIPKGGHLIAITHPKEVSNFIRTSF